MTGLRAFLTSAIAAVAAIVASPAISQERVLNVYNWSDYIDRKLLAQFTKETGIRVVYDTYDSNESLEAKLLAGNTGYDLVLPSATFLQRQIAAGVYRKLDRSRLKNTSGLWKEIDKQLSVYDPGNQYAINYMWFTTGIAYNTKKIAERTNGKPPVSWNDVLIPENLKRFADCGVYFLDSPEDMFSIALKFLKLNPDSGNSRDLRKAGELLRTLRPLIRKFHSSEYINALANGDICLAIGWAGDSFQARNRAREAKYGVEIAFVLPAEGTLISMDNFAIPIDAKYVDEG
ncbi:MAG: extracellular solute-binding protein, partial [Beijerinckiaceae bacterium]